uniref:Uncharacterized protein n=1 Tax=Arundo donax TaxID=35708 RepID=A0A0A9HME1_ARUDO
MTFAITRRHLGQEDGNDPRVASSGTPALDQTPSPPAELSCGTRLRRYRRQTA